MFVIGFVKSGLQIFGPNAKNPTLRYVAYKDGETGNLIHQAILQKKSDKVKNKYKKLQDFLWRGDPSVKVSANTFLKTLNVPCPRADPK